MTDVFHAINRDIWTPFSESYAAGDVERYLRIHATDFLWIRADSGTIEGLEGYRALSRQSFADLAARGVSLRIAFRFTERIANGDVASERGLFRMSGEGPDGPKPVLYGRFHTIARRLPEGWRLVVDYEYPGSGTDGAADYEAAHAADDVAVFAGS
jgi:ketosteroid isomerase-like protein